MTHNRIEEVTKLLNNKKILKKKKKENNNTINLFLTLNYYAGQSQEYRSRATEI